MKNEVITNAQLDRPFSSWIETESVVFVSGQGDLDTIAGRITCSDIESQTIQALENIRSVLLAVCLDMNELAKGMYI